MVSAVLLMAAPLAHAAQPDPLVEGARQCTQQFPAVEQANNIPTHLLAAISSVETGRWHDKLGLPLPWPWTINVEGKGYYFDTKAEAIAKTAAYLHQGVTSIDVGCMQVNLKHHPHAFSTLEAAFDPATNVAYGAKFLRSNYDEEGDWIKATADYHSRTNKQGMEYLALIEKSWNRIVGKVQQARARQGIAPEQVAQQNFTPPAEKPVSRSTVKPIAEVQHLKVIQVSNSQPAHSDVLVVHPAVAQAAAPAVAVKVADAAPAQNDMMVKQSGDSIRRVTIDSEGQSSNNGASGTHFVFAN